MVNGRALLVLVTELEMVPLTVPRLQLVFHLRQLQTPLLVLARELLVLAFLVCLRVY
jgi:hypothetical protein